MSKLFWTVNAVVLVAALALWGVGTLGVRGEARDVKGQVDVKVRRIENLHRDRQNLPNEDSIEAAKKHKSLLREEKEKVKEVMRSYDLNAEEIDWDDSPPPMDGSLADFREWLTKQYEKKNKLLSDGGVSFPEGAEEARMRGEVQDWEDVTVEDLPRLLRELVVMREMCAALAAAKADVTYAVKGEGGQLVSETNTHKVDQLKLLEFGVRRRSGLRRAEKEPEEDKPHKEHLVTVTFISHLNVVPDVMRRVERSKEALFVVRSVTVRRSGEARRGPVGYGAPPTEEKFLRNAEDHEAPVEAQIGFGFFEFPAAREKEQ